MTNYNNKRIKEYVFTNLYAVHITDLAAKSKKSPIIIFAPFLSSSSKGVDILAKALSRGNFLFSIKVILWDFINS